MGESLGEGGKNVKQRFQRPALSLKNYGGGELHIVSEIECCLTHGDYTVKALLQVQKGAPVDLLLGTDTLPGLDFSFLQKERDESSVELPDDMGSTTGQEPVDNPSDLDQPGPTVPPTAKEVATIKMLQAARIPARHFKLVRVTVVD